MSDSEKQAKYLMQEDDGVEVLCDNFDQLWADSQRPSIKEFLTQVDAAHRHRLLEMLVAIDVEYRFRDRDDVDAGDYVDLGSAAVKYAEEAIRIVEREPTFRDADELSPSIDGYRIERKIGEGGMGTVYLAEQQKPVRRQVAIKVVKTGYDSKEIIGRFEAERQALAIMDHPNIASVLDAGSTAAGSPYFTMEWVQGIPITRYCDEREQTIEGRILIFLEVCRAVQHAHQKGIIHRDLKPTNILVTDAHGVAAPKVIDFGLAKAMENRVRLTDETILTSFGTIVGSPQYMSPEQAELDQADIDTRSDVYSLGVIFYELLTGTTPLAVGQIHNRTPLQALARIRESDATRPSVRLNEDSNAAEQVAQQRKSSVSKLRQMYRGELDWIAMKALDHDRSRRYESVEAFQRDIQHFLDNEPVTARPPSSWYVLGKTMQKYKTLITTLALFFVLLVTTTAIIANLYFNEKAARSSAEEKNARAKYFSAIGFWERNQTKEAVKVLHEIDEKYRFIEWNLAQNQFQENGASFGEASDQVVYAAVMSPDEKLIASAGLGGVINIWDVESREIIQRFDNNSEASHALSFHPNGRMIAAGNSDGHVKVWDLESEKVVFQVADPNGPIRCVSFSHDGKQLAIGGGPNPFGSRKVGESRIRIFNISDPDDYIELSGHEARINSIAFSHDDSQLVSGSRDATVRVWDVKTGRQTHRLDAKAFVLSVAFNPSSNLIACGTADNQLIMWRLDPGKTTMVWRRDAHGFEGDTVDCISFSPDGSQLATGGFDGTVRIREVEWGNQTKVLRGHHATVFSAVYAPDSKRLLSASEDGTVKLWNLERLSESRILTGHTQSVNSIDFSPDGNWLLSASGRNREDASSIRPEPIDNSVRLWNLQTGKSERLGVHADSVTDVEFNPVIPEGHRFVSSSMDGTIRFWQREEGWGFEEVTAHGGEPVNGIAFHPNGDQLVSAGSDYRLRVWNVDSQSEVVELNGHQSPVLDVTWSGNGKWIASAAAKEIIVWNARSGEIVWQREVAWASSVVFSPDSSILVSGQGELRVWNSQTGEPINRLSHSRLGHYFVSFYDDVDVPRLLTGGRQGRAWLWDSKTWEELLQLDIDSVEKWNFVYDGEFSPDGRLVATANRDGTIRIWGTPPARSSD